RLQQPHRLAALQLPSDRQGGFRPDPGRRELAAMPASVEAMRAGEIGYGHLTVMARTAAAVGKRFEESRLLPLARKHTPGKFYYKSLHYRHSIDAKAYCQEQSEQEINHHLSLSTSESGHLLINGVLDPVGG